MLNGDKMQLINATAEITKLEEMLNSGNLTDEKDKQSVRFAINVLKGAPTIKERPTSQWVAREDMDYLDKNKVVHNHFECNKCGFIHDFIDGHTSQYNFCPNCGADMQEHYNAQD